MVKKIFHIILLIITTISLIGMFQEKIEKETTESFIVRETEKYLKKEPTTSIGVLEIPKLSIKNPIYEIKSIENNVDKNIELLKESTFPNQENSELIFAAHSGNGTHAYFKKLDQLKIGEKINFYWQDTFYQYQMIKKQIVPKTGSIFLENYNFKRLILVTCSKTDEDSQEIYYAKLISEKSLKKE